VRDLMWRPVGQLVRFIAVIHPTTGKNLLMHLGLPLFLGPFASSAGR
jgi:hypothetical protein